MLCVLAPVHRTEDNCCYEMMHIASRSSRGTCVHLSFLLLAIKGLIRGFVQLAYTYSMYGPAYAMCISPCTYRTEANCCYEMMHIASLSSHGTCSFVFPYCWP